VKKILLALLSLAIAAMVFSACGGDGDGGNKHCNPTGQDIGTCTNIVACCEGTNQSNMQCWYESGTRKWDCDGSNCQAAAQRMAADCAGT